MLNCLQTKVLKMIIFGFYSYYTNLSKLLRNSLLFLLDWGFMIFSYVWAYKCFQRSMGYRCFVLPEQTELQKLLYMSKVFALTGSYSRSQKDIKSMNKHWTVIFIVVMLIFKCGNQAGANQKTSIIACLLFDRLSKSVLSTIELFISYFGVIWFQLAWFEKNSSTAWPIYWWR